MVRLGLFATPEEAALSYARTPEAQATVAAAAAPPAPPPMTAEEALRQAEAEGLTLLRSESNATGFKGVSIKSGKSTPYQAEVRRGGKQVSLGCFETPEEAALSYARTPEAQAAAAAPPAPPPMTAEEALRQAEAEGLTLLKSDNDTGFKRVSFKSGKSKPYLATAQRGGKQVSLGCFETPEEAALCYARSPEAQLAAPPKPPPMTAEEALRQAETEGLTLLPSDNGTGFRCVHFRSGEIRPYEAYVWRGGKQVTLGRFATAEEAALCYAQTPEAQAAAAAPPAPPPMTAKEALQQASSRQRRRG